MALRHSNLLAQSVFMFLIAATGAQAQDDIVRIEEDWCLTVGNPDTSVAGPQVTCVISPIGNANSLYAIINLNHRAGDWFAPGGMQLQLWYGEIALSNKVHPNGGLLHHSGENITWTQDMSVDDEGKLKFTVKNGQSQTWGSFGGQGYLTSTIATNLQNLNAYSPTVSIQNSGVVFAGNRVESLVLKRIRVHTASGQVQTFTLNQAAH